MSRPSGLSDKLYWRPVHDTMWHCFKKLSGGGYISLCERWTLSRCGGQRACRPPAYMRCARCDVAEIGRRDKDESMPESPNWEDAVVRKDDS